MQGNLFEGYPKWGWKVTEVRLSKTDTWTDPETGEVHHRVLSCKTVPIPPQDFPPEEPEPIYE